MRHSKRGVLKEQIERKKPEKNGRLKLPPDTVIQTVQPDKSVFMKGQEPARADILTSGLSQKQHLFV